MGSSRRRAARGAGGRAVRRGQRIERSGAAAQAPLRGLRNSFPPVEILSAEQVAAIESAAPAVLRDGGLEFRHPQARRLLAQAGATVDEDTAIVRFDPAMVLECVALAPERFVLHARNAAANAVIGGDAINFSPVAGPPNVSDLIAGRRPGTADAMRDLIRLNQALGVTQLAGASPVEPVDLPVESRHLDLYLAQASLTDRAWNARGIGRTRVEDALEMVALARGVSREALVTQPSLTTVINVNSPRRVDAELLDGLMAMVENGQPPVVTPFTLAGAMSPVSLAGSLVQQTAEGLAMVALTQILRPGCPVVLGGFTSNVDMKSGSPAFGTPEYVKATLAGGQLARHFGLPYRSSSVNASNCVDAQAVYETSMSLWAAIMSHANIVYHATGWLEGGLTASFEKTVVDAEMLRQWAQILQPVDTSESELAVDAIIGVAPGGHFFGAEHTLSRYEGAFYQPMLSDWRNFETWEEDGARGATDRASTIWRSVLDTFEAPHLEPERLEAMQAFVARRRTELDVQS